MLITTGTCYEFTLGREGHWPPYKTDLNGSLKKKFK